MRLEGNHDALAIGLLSRLKRDVNLGRVVTIVVDDCHPFLLTNDREPTLHSFEAA